MRILRQFVQYDKYDKTVSCNYDIHYSIDTLMSYCVSMACDLNFVIRNQYEATGEILEQMQKEYKIIIGKLNAGNC